MEGRDGALQMPGLLQGATDRRLKSWAGSRQQRVTVGGGLGGDMASAGTLAPSWWPVGRTRDSSGGQGAASQDTSRGSRPPGNRPLPQQQLEEEDGPGARPGVPGLDAMTS